MMKTGTAYYGVCVLHYRYVCFLLVMYQGYMCLLYAVYQGGGVGLNICVSYIHTCRCSL